MSNLYNTYSAYLKEKYNKRVYRIGVDGGFSCPNRDKSKYGGCIFCDLSGAVAVYQREEEKGYCLRDDLLHTRIKSLEEQIERGLAFIKRRYKAEGAILYFQSWSNTYAKVEDLKQIYDRALKIYDFCSLVVSTRPDLLSDEVCALLASYKNDDREVWVEVGLQSGNDDTLERINRSHSVDEYKSAVKRLHKYNLKVATHIIIMPSYDSKEELINTISCINEVQSDAVKIHNIHITHNTELERRYLENGCFSVSSFKRHVETLAFIIARLNKNMIVERIITETPKARLLSPKEFKDKRDLIEELEKYMVMNNLKQGCLLPIS